MTNSSRGGSGGVHSRLVLGANNLSPTEVGALSVVAHPDIGQCLSPHLSGLALLPASQLAILYHFISFSFIHFLHLTPSFSSGALLARKRAYSYGKYIPRRHIPCRKKELSKYLLAKIKGLSDCVFYILRVQRKLCQKFLAVSFPTQRHPLAIFNGPCIINPPGTAEDMPNLSADLFYVQVRPCTVDISVS